MAIVSSIATGGFENSQIANIPTSSLENDRYVAFIYSKYPITSVQNSTTGVNWSLVGSDKIGPFTLGYSSCYTFQYPSNFSGDIVIVQSTSSSFMSWVIFRVRPDTNKLITFRAKLNAGFNTSTPSIVVPGELTATSIIFGAQYVDDNVYFTDSDMTDGSWSIVSKHTSINNNRALAVQYKETTGSSAQNYGGTLASSEFGNIAAFNFQEVDLGIWGMKA